MKRLTSDELLRLEFHPIARNIPQVIVSDKKAVSEDHDDESRLVLYEGQILLDYGRYRRALVRGWCWVEEYDSQLHGCDPVTLALRATYLSDTQRALAAARQLRLLHTRPLYLAPYDAQLLRPLRSKRAAEHFADVEWNVRAHSLQRARVIDEQCEVPSFVRAVEEGRITLAKGAEAVRMLGHEPDTLERIARLSDRLVTNRAIERAIAEVDQPPARRQRRVQHQRQATQQRRHDWIFTFDDRAQAQRRRTELFKWISDTLGHRGGDREPTPDELFQAGYEMASGRKPIFKMHGDLDLSDPDPVFDMTWKSLQ